MSSLETGDDSGRAVKIYLLLINHSRVFFYADDSEKAHETGDDDGSSTPPPSGIYGWFHARYTKFRSAWQQPDSGALLWMRRAWDWLHSWAHPDEVMLARLWSARRIDLYHPAARCSYVVRAIWDEYLGQQWRRHLVWLSLNGAIAPIAIVTLWILPGPNLIGYWFAYRAIHHLFVVWGIGRVRRNKIPTELHRVAALDVPIERDGEGKATHAALTGRATRLDEHVAWHSSPRAARIASKSAATPTADELEPANQRPENS
jgi:hypothetical protein